MSSVQFSLYLASTANQDSDIPLVLVFYLAYKWCKKTKFVSVYDIPVRQAMDEARDDPENVPIRTSKLKRLNILWG